MHVLRFHALHCQLRTLAAGALCLMLVGVGCAKKPVHAVPAVLAPSIETEPQPVAAPQPPDDQNASAPQPAPASEPQANQQKPKPKPRRPITRRPVQAPQQPVAEAPKVETAKPADNSAQITADVPRAAVQSQRQNTENMLHNSEGQLGRITRSLGDSEQGMLRQARNYIAQSNQALQAGDIERAYNLAVKASLLANELSK
jgi:outer membrane biosynthesis protein TonB